MVVNVALGSVGFVSGGTGYALENLNNHKLDGAAFLGHLHSSFNDLGIKTGAGGATRSASTETDAWKGSLGQLSSPATGAMLAANEISNTRG